MPSVPTGCAAGSAVSEDGGGLPHYTVIPFGPMAIQCRRTVPALSGLSLKTNSKKN